MNKVGFIEKYGSIMESKYNQSHRNYLDMLGGKFYTTGFFREGMNPEEDNLPWESLDQAIQLADELVKTLREGECYALQSEGSASFYPFIYSNGLVDIFPDFIGRDEVIDGAKVLYNELDEWDCIFWEEDLAEEYIEEFAELMDDVIDTEANEKAKQAFQTVSDLMKAELKNIISFDVVHPERTEYPVIIGGTYKDHLFVGVITSCVRT